MPTDTEHVEKEQTQRRCRHKTASIHFYPVISDTAVWLAAYRNEYLSTMRQCKYFIRFIYFGVLTSKALKCKSKFSEPRGNLRRPMRFIGLEYINRRRLQYGFICKTTLLSIGRVIFGCGVMDEHLMFYGHLPHAAFVQIQWYSSEILRTQIRSEYSEQNG